MRPPRRATRSTASPPRSVRSDSRRHTPDRAPCGRPVRQPIRPGATDGQRDTFGDSAAVHQTTAQRKVRLAQDAWNTCDPDRVALSYSEDSQWRNAPNPRHRRRSPPSATPLAGPANDSWSHAHPERRQGIAMTLLKPFGGYPASASPSHLDPRGARRAGGRATPKRICAVRERSGQLEGAVVVRVRRSVVITWGVKLSRKSANLLRNLEEGERTCHRSVRAIRRCWLLGEATARRPLPLEDRSR